ncbi:unnamed protein product [Caenorhabditis bovis]|uniref:Coiled-coil domain-containing protein n=1 Tax=Caenorhabditis bovis TaxID=2654633 RepID=A0A8S1EKZ2_9PELO|nr:unnamed protein product [Caenorhabditis bovis]
MSDEQVSTFTQIRQKLMSAEDEALAQKLQAKEFEEHYERNRKVNGMIVEDRKKSKEEQKNEDELSVEIRRLRSQHRMCKDEELARWLQEEYRLETEKQLANEAQLNEDEELAWKIANGHFDPDVPASSTTSQ